MIQIKTIKKLSLLALLSVLIVAGVNMLGALPVYAAPATYTVNSTDDDVDASLDGVCDTGGPLIGGQPECTLRAAIQEANNTSDADTIEFNVSGTADFTNGGQDGYVISPSSALPDLNESVTIDGYSQPGSQANTTSFPEALNTRLLIQLDGSIVGESVALTPNNATGTFSIQGLIISNWVDVSGPGGSIDAADGQISITGNFIGTNPDGTSAELNSQAITSGSNLSQFQVGGANPGDRNLISGNGNGIAVGGHVVIQGNFIGVDISGTTSLGNQSYGALFYADGQSLVGGEDPSQGNIIANNGIGGIAVLGGTFFGQPNQVAIIGNSIYDNGGIGTELAEASGFTADINVGTNPNDVGDSDTGPNDYINHPIINSATYNGDDINVNFSLDAAGSPSGLYRLEFFANDGNTEGNGKTYLGFTNVSNGTSYTVETLVVPSGYDMSGKYITATATQFDSSFDNGDFGSTSEFSVPVAFVLGASTGTPANSTSNSDSNQLANTGSPVLLIVIASLSLISSAGGVLFLTKTNYQI